VVSGTYYVGLIADDGDQVLELDETNNTGVDPTAGPPADLDVTVASVNSYEDRTTTSDDYIYCAWEVKNIGNGPAGAHRVGFYLSTDTTITTSDMLIDSYSSVGLAVGATEGSSSRYMGFHVPTDTYYLGIIADDQDEVRESDETNNTDCDTSTSMSFTSPPYPDLEFVSIWLDSYTNGSVQFDWQIKNSGTETCYSYYVGYYLSTNTLITTADTSIGYNYFSSLAPGAYEGQTDRTITFDVAAGTYYLGVFADYADSKTELDETNNTGYHGNSFYIAGQPDLGDAWVWWNSYEYNWVNLDWDCWNQGGTAAGGHRVGLYLSTNTLISTTDTLIAHYWSPGLAANAQEAEYNRMVTFSVPYGTYYLGVYADDTMMVPESNENNNTDNDISMGLYP
jgi:serralysin